MFSYEKQKFTKRVAVTSIAEYVFKREWPADPKENKAIIVYCLNPEKTKLDFFEDPETQLTAELTSGLTQNPDLLAFRINNTDTTRFFSLEQLTALVRARPHVFSKTDDVKDLLKAFKNFQVKFEMFVEKANDNMGNTKDLITTAIDRTKIEVPLKWDLKLPLFVSTDAVELELELEIQKLPNNMPGFGFFSIDTEVLLREKAAEIIGGEVDKFRDQFVCLEVE